MSENPRRERQARNFTTNVTKTLDLKSSTEQILSKNCHWVPLIDFKFIFDSARLGLFSSANIRQIAGVALPVVFLLFLPCF